MNLLNYQEFKPIAKDLYPFDKEIQLFRRESNKEN